MSSDTLLMPKGVDASLNNSGVTWLTLSSVHCAESNTATRRVKLLEWSSGIGVLGYTLFSVSDTNKALSDFFMGSNVA